MTGLGVARQRDRAFGGAAQDLLDAHAQRRAPEPQRPLCAAAIAETDLPPSPPGPRARRSRRRRHYDRGADGSALSPGAAERTRAEAAGQARAAAPPVSTTAPRPLPALGLPIFRLGRNVLDCRTNLYIPDRSSGSAASRVGGASSVRPRPFRRKPPSTFSKGTSAGEEAGTSLTLHSSEQRFGLGDPRSRGSRACTGQRFVDNERFPSIRPPSTSVRVRDERSLDIITYA